ncbi:MAG: hypothetical protein FWC39_02470 [Bacteroidetes bacterium]|nr:hypothetical protein [Bacteroidota bacterium]
MATMVMQNQWIVTVPSEQSLVLKSISKALNWSFTQVKPKKNGLDLAMEDIKQGRVNTYKNSKELFEKLSAQ